MAYKRTFIPTTLPSGDELTRDMVGIGMNFAAEKPELEPNIENTLLAAAIEAMVSDDLRVLDVLVSWLDVHHSAINADRLLRAVEACSNARVRAFWSAVGFWLQKDRRFARFTRLYDGPRQDLLKSGSAFQIQRRGEDVRFAEGPLRVPAGVLRGRPGDVLSRESLARQHSVYRWRVIMGPSYRADMWAVLEQEPGLDVTELARRAYGSFATAWQVQRDWGLVGAVPT